MSTAKQILGTVIGVCLALLIVTRASSADLVIAPEASAAVETQAAPACGKCGDGYCNPRCGETATSCPRDCGGTTSVAAGAPCGKCGDGYCNPRCGETATSCPRDCGASTLTDDCSL